MIVDVSAIVSSLSGSTLTRRRPSYTIGADGRASVSYTDSTISGAVSTPTRADLDRIAAGTDASHVRVVHSTSEIRTADKASDIAADLLSIDGVIYTVTAAQDYDGHGRYYRAVCVRGGS